MADELTDAIWTNAQGPKSASGDSGSTSQHDPSQQIEADKYVCGMKAVATKNRGIHFSKLAAPGAV